MILQSKSSGDGGGGCGYSIKQPTHRETLYRSTLALYVDYQNGVQIHKNKYSNITGKPTTEQLVDIMCRVFVEHAFDGRMKLFQAGMEEKLKRAVNEIIKE